jgi:uncharacterized hydrophobic protein (TIGR00271 family)
LKQYLSGMANLFSNFRLKGELEPFEVVREQISRGVEFKGTNLWILVFAIFIASLGLNVNSTAVIIGAMLISPLMGPIMGIGLALSVNDFELLKKALRNFGLATVISLMTSTLYFFLTPLGDAHSEILARTTPNIYDVLIAFFGGLAGMLVNSSRLKGNVIPGVAIATALMPPLCTAGYGLATFQFSFFYGAAYLFFINAVFIALATYITSRLLRFPVQHRADPVEERRTKWAIWLITAVTLLPSIYFGYDSVRRVRFTAAANRFVDEQANFSNDYLLRRKIDATARSIQLTYGGDAIPDTAIRVLQRKLPDYGLLNTSIDIRQGFVYTKDDRYDLLQESISEVLAERDRQIQLLRMQVDTLLHGDTSARQLFRELKIQLPSIQAFSYAPVSLARDSTVKVQWQATVFSAKPVASVDRKRLEQWLQVRTGKSPLVVRYESTRN